MGEARRTVETLLLDHHEPESATATKQHSTMNSRLGKFYEGEACESHVSGTQIGLHKMRKENETRIRRRSAIRSCQIVSKCRKDKRGRGQRNAGIRLERDACSQARIAPKRREIQEAAEQK